MEYKRLVVLHEKLLGEVVDWLEVLRREWVCKLSERSGANKKDYRKLCVTIYSAKVLQEFTKEKLKEDKNQ